MFFHPFTHFTTIAGAAVRWNADELTWSVTYSDPKMLDEMFGRNWSCIRKASDEGILRIQEDIEVFYSHSKPGRIRMNLGGVVMANPAGGAALVLHAPAGGLPVHDALGA